MAVNKGTAKNILSRAFVDANEEITEDDALTKIYDSLEIVRELKDTQKNDDKLNAASQICKDLKAGYSSAIKNEEAKIGFLRDKVTEIRSETPNTDGFE